MTTSELQEDVATKSKNISRLSEIISQLQRDVDASTRELELKGQEVLQIRRESNEALRLVVLSVILCYAIWLYGILRPVDLFT